MSTPFAGRPEWAGDCEADEQEEVDDLLDLIRDCVHARDEYGSLSGREATNLVDAVDTLDGLLSGGAVLPRAWGRRGGERVPVVTRRPITNLPPL